MRVLVAAAMLCAFVDACHAEVASCYGAESGRQTASGERFDWRCPNDQCTAAHRSLPFGTLVRVTYQGRAVIDVRITDRGPFHRDRKTKLYDRDIDLAEGACRRLGMFAAGVGQVDLQTVGFIGGKQPTRRRVVIKQREKIHGE
jgi:rare lipoprotein A